MCVPRQKQHCSERYDENDHPFCNLRQFPSGYGTSIHWLLQNCRFAAATASNDRNSRDSIELYSVPPSKGRVQDIELRVISQPPGGRTSFTGSRDARFVAVTVKARPALEDYFFKGIDPTRN